MELFRKNEAWIESVLDELWQAYGSKLILQEGSLSSKFVIVLILKLIQEIIVTIV